VSKEDKHKPKSSLDQQRRKWERVAAIVLTGTRREMNLSQQELANRVSWSRNMIANLESGRRSMRLSDLFLIAPALETTADLLMQRILHWGKS
jgi:DNA-binding XRE family transcriptional regulator